MSRLDDLELLELPDRASLRSWLAENHAASPGVWLAVGKKGNSVSQLSYDDAVEEGLAFGWIDSTTRRLDADRYQMLFTRRRPISTWARTNKARVDRLLAAGLMAEAGLRAVEVAKENGSWMLLDDVESLVMPEDLTRALAANPAAEQGFAALSDSAKKTALYWIGSARRTESREKRISATVVAAAEGKAPLG